jgi:hypothetical protein
MVARIRKAELLAQAEIVAQPALDANRACDDRTFELPRALHITMALLFAGFVTVLCAAFATPYLLVPYAVCIFFIAAFFTVPSLWAGMRPEENKSRALGWDRFLDNGIDTATGRSRAGDAAVLVLTLPVLIFGWAVAVAMIAAFVR